MDRPEKTPSESPFNIPSHAAIDRRDDAQFQHDIKHLIERAEKIRINEMKRYQLRRNIGMTLNILIMLAGCAGCGWFLLVNSDPIKAAACMVIAIAMPLVINMWMQDPVDSYKSNYKRQYLPELAQLMGGFDYHPTRGIAENVIRKTGIIPPYKHYHSEDCFRGYYKGSKVLFSEARLNTTKKESAFKGLFVLLELPSAIFEGHTIITANRYMADEYENTRWRKLTRIPMSIENKRWDRFVAFSDKPDVAQLFLGEKFIKELAEADIAFGDPNISAVLFREKYVFLAIPHEKDMFEASELHIPVSSHNHAIACKKEIDQILEVIDIFDLYAANN